jgi:hypothetical protein
MAKSGDITIGTWTAPGVPGVRHRVTRILAVFKEPGPRTGTLRMKSGNTVVWEADVSGGLNQFFPGIWDMPTEGESLTVELPGATIQVWGPTLY